MRPCCADTQSHPPTHPTSSATPKVQAAGERAAGTASNLAGKIELVLAKGDGKDAAGTDAKGDAAGAAGAPAEAATDAKEAAVAKPAAKEEPPAAKGDGSKKGESGGDKNGEKEEQRGKGDR